MHPRARRLRSRLLWLAVSSSAVLALAPGAALARGPLPGTEQDTEVAVMAALTKAHERFKKVDEGANADYIPALARVDSKLFGIALVTTDGRVHVIGDSEALFSIQSVSKIFTLALVMQSLGPEAIVEKIGVDATGQRFNSIMAIEMNPQRTVNSLVNPGAIATTSLVPGRSAEAKWANIIGTLQDFAGRELLVSQEVYKSESETNQRNQAIAKLLEAYGRMYADPAMSVDLYTRQCSVNVSAKDLAVMAATLANGGTNPITKKDVLKPEYVERVLAVMATAGLYDDSGRWLYTVGLPAKSGVGGGILAVAPGRFGIAAFSPPVDAAGNSVRAARAIDLVADELGASPYASQPR